jgi:hypothetical protein
MNLTIRTAGARRELLAGEFEWQLDQPAKSLELHLLWFTRGKGTQDVKVVDQQRLDSPPLRGERSFSFTLPAEPYSFSGRLISLVWALELVAEPGGETERLEFTCAPGGHETVLEPAQ